MATPKRIDLTAVSDAKLYPDALRAAEEARGRGRRIGIALSGGGIRSATLSLGFFQGLAQQSLVQFVDYMSTVSGGGYFGAFFGHLLHRPPASYTGDPAARTKADDVLKDQNSAPLKFLRENGRYLSPNGAGDLLAAGAGALRNWVSVLVVLGLLALFVLTLTAMGRYGIEDALDKWNAFPVIPWPAWLSPLALLLVFLAPTLVVPPGWAYWLVREGAEPDPFLTRAAKWTAPLLGIASLWYWYTRRDDLWAWTWQWIPVAFAVFSLLSVARFIMAWVRSGQSQQAMREHLTRGLSRALMVLLVFTVVVAVDTIGQSIVGLTDKRLLVSYGGIVGLVGIFRNRLLSLATQLRANQGPGLPKSVLFALTATALMLVLLGAVASVPHFVAQWNSEFPTWTPHEAPAGVYGSLAILALIAGFMAFAVSRVWSFVNRSSLHAVYEARIRRAYLGASNKARVGEGENRPAVTDPHPDDGLSWAAYNPSGNGGPIHLINVTINETVDGYSQVQQRDRKGVGMAIGPDGISVGRTHHALFAPTDAPAWTLGSLNPFRRSTQVKLSADAAPPRFRVFPDGSTSTPEPLDVGQWVAISGGAVSTGLGARTNMALSILIGFFNVRLGYWWQSGVSPSARRGRTRRAWTRRLSAAMRRLWPVQSALLDEWLARFPGVARHEWNLTDGGHFENMGAYELLRRRLPLIIVCDNEEDSEYSFSGLSNLVRKARTDLNAEITFLDDTQLRSSASPFSMPMPMEVGTLDSLRRGTHTTEKVGAKEQVVVDALDTRLSWSHAAVARIEYKDVDEAGKPAPTYGCLLYVKPTLTGDEPIDVLQYHTEHPAFPQEPTSDQFFDEAQWESYRRLGEHMALKLFDSRMGLRNWVEKVAKGAAP